MPRTEDFSDFRMKNKNQPFGGETRVRTMRKRTNIPTIAPSLLIRSMSVIFTAFADLTRNMTEILKISILAFFEGW